METLTLVLIWVGIGFSFATGICLVIAVICLLMNLYVKLFPEKNRPPLAEFQKLLHIEGAHCIFLSARLLLGLDIKKPLQDLRAEFWQKDIVVPFFQIIQLNGNPKALSFGRSKKYD